MYFRKNTVHDYLYQGVLVYLDDILIYSQDEQEHIELVKKVLTKLHGAVVCKIVKI